MGKSEREREVAIKRGSCTGINVKRFKIDRIYNFRKEHGVGTSAWSTFIVTAEW